MNNLSFVLNREREYDPMREISGGYNRSPSPDRMRYEHSPGRTDRATPPLIDRYDRERSPYDEPPLPQFTPDNKFRFDLFA